MMAHPLHYGASIEVRRGAVQNLEQEEKQNMAEAAVVTHRAEQPAATPPPTRREFLTRSAGTGLALLLAGVPRGWVGAVYASDAPVCWPIVSIH